MSDDLIPPGLHPFYRERVKLVDRVRSGEPMCDQVTGAVARCERPTCTRCWPPVEFREPTEAQVEGGEGKRAAGLATDPAFGNDEDVDTWEAEPAEDVP